MTEPISTYSFLPWLRQGIANNISAADMDPNVKVRAAIEVDLKLTGQAIGGGELTRDFNQTIALYGPGDIVGVERRAILRNEPRNWITNFEPNYFPFIEFYHEDFLWRYTPAAPNTSRLRPWLALVVLAEDEFTDGRNIADKPLPFIEVPNAADKFPAAEQLWAWAHVHANDDLAATEQEIVSTSTGAFLTKFEALLAADPDRAYSRLMCPRRLGAKTAYHAFLIPAFETGRLAGLGYEPSLSPHATSSAWADYPAEAADPRKDPEYFPYYFRWYFRTGTVGDFEYLVRLLEPRPVNKEVGCRDMDVLHPGLNLRGITHPELGGILKLGGALRVPFDTMKEEDKAEFKKYDEWYEAPPDGYPQAFQKDLATFINLRDEYATKPAAQAHQDTALKEEIRTDPDPLITPPLYGRWHALTQRLLTRRDGSDVDYPENWVHDLNLDPRYRVASGFGTSVVQKNQETYMDAAWEQVGDILEANRRMRLAQLARAVSARWHTRYVRPLAAFNIEKLLLTTQPVHNRVTEAGYTVPFTLANSVLPNSLLSFPTRQALRPRGRLLSLSTFTDQIRKDNLLTRVVDDGTAAIRPIPPPEGLVSVEDIAEEMLSEAAPKPIVELIRKYPWLRYALAAVLVVILVLLWIFAPVFWLAGAGTALTAAVGWLLVRLTKWTKAVTEADSLLPENQTRESVEELPRSPDFRISTLQESFTPTRGATDSQEAVRFKEALRGVNEVITVSRKIGREQERRKPSLSGIADAVTTAISPGITIPRMISRRILIPARIAEQMSEQFKEAMAYPEFDIPMYEPLVDISSELFLPNINKIEQNTISLLETNQPFIEAYMVGLNHEFGRELLWREYPTDQRGSYFRQFWNVSSFLPPEDEISADAEALRESLKDIPKLHLWSRRSDLGDHDHRETGGEAEEEVVLVIRGELLKKYPNAVIYAHRAKWQMKDSEIDNTVEREMVEIDEANPLEDVVKTPLYEAKVEPDVYFFGFDLKAEEARGGTGDNPSDDPGWFFVIKERPGEPRFGLDIGSNGGSSQDAIHVWNDLTWERVSPGIVTGDHIRVGPDAPSLTLTYPGGPGQGELVDQHGDDIHVSWNEHASAADLAYLTFQAPVLVAVHAAEMLPRPRE